MKILHTSDWHLGKKLGHYSRLEEQINVLDEICTIADEHAADVVVIAGDLFDTYNPPNEAVDLFYSTVKRLSREGKRPVFAIAGNHDSPDRIQTPDPLARECGIIFIGNPQVKVVPFSLESGLRLSKTDNGFLEIMLPDSKVPLRILYTPYANEFRLKTYLNAPDKDQQLRDLLAETWRHTAEKYCDTAGVNILVSHLFFMKRGQENLEEPEDEKPILHVGGAQAIYTENIPEQLQYVALGHLHRRQIIDESPCPVVYCGSPLGYSFAESNQEKFVLLTDIEPGNKARIQKITLTRGKKLLRFRAGSIEEAVAWLKENEHTLVELTIVSDNYLTATDRKTLHNAHDGIIGIIPEIKNTASLAANENAVDLSKSIDALFTDYFFREKGQQPSQRIMDLFNEIKAGEGEE